MTEQPTILRQIQRLPRAIQWLGLAVVAVVLFLLWDEYVRPYADRWRVDADDIAREVAEVRQSTEMARRLSGREMTEVVLAVGPVAKPGDDKEGGRLLQEAAFAVTRKYRSVTDMSLDMRGVRGKLNATLTSGIAGGKRLQRLTAELKFLASPEDAMAIIADLERHPDIESVTAVRLTRSDDGMLKVNVDLDAWVEEN